MPNRNSIRSLCLHNICLVLMLVLPLSAVASQKDQNTFAENASLSLTRSIVIELYLPADSVALRENVRAMKRLAIQGDQWLGNDKFKHFGASLLLTVSVKTLADNAFNFDRESATFSAAGLTFLAGFGKELYDDTYPNNIFSLKDLVADLAGILAGVLLVQLF